MMGAFEPLLKATEMAREQIQALFQQVQKPKATKA